MPHIVDTLLDEAQRAIADMRAATLRAERIRHVRTAAADLGRPVASVAEDHPSSASLDAAPDHASIVLADQMMFRSECAHGWWAMVVPVPPELPRRTSHAAIPGWRAGLAFWDAGCPARCAPETGSSRAVVP